MDEETDLIKNLVLFGPPETGYRTNPKEKNRKNHIEINGEKVVCVAKGGECRFNPNYYSIGMNNAKSWKTPIIDETARMNADIKCWFVMTIQKESVQKL